jgi:hypothetical protein
MRADHAVQSAAPDELAVRLARVGLPAGGAQGRQAALPGPLQAFHRALLGAFLSDAGPPGLAMVGRLASGLELEPEAALTALAAADLVHLDPAAGRVRVAIPSPERPPVTGWSWPMVHPWMPCVRWTPWASP